MIDGKTLQTILSKFLESEVAKFARVQVQMPNGDLHDISQIKLMENMIVGGHETHRIVLKTERERHKMSKVIRSSSMS